MNPCDLHPIPFDQTDLEPLAWIYLESVCLHVAKVGSHWTWSMVGRPMWGSADLALSPNGPIFLQWPPTMVSCPNMGC